VKLHEVRTRLPTPVSSRILPAPLTGAANAGPLTSAVFPSPRSSSADPPSLHLETLRQITVQMTVARDVAEVLDVITRALVTTAGAALARIWLLRTAADCSICRAHEWDRTPATTDAALHLTASGGLYSRMDGALHRIGIGEQKVGEIAASGRPLYTDDLLGDPRILDKDWVRREGLESFAGYPLLFRSELVGVLGVFTRQRLTAQQFQSLEVFAAQAATAIKTAELFSEVERLNARLAVENTYLQEEFRSDRGFEGIIGTSVAIRDVLRMVRLAGPTDACVLLSGESGTGKELIACAVHDLSPRHDRAMIRVNCGAIPSTLVESEFFGHERGAFTGAVARRIGRFELADRSTLFLDEVGDLPLEAQVTLLRVLQEQEFERVGGTRPIQVDVRAIAATNRDLGEEIAGHRFRPDLFYRLNVMPIRVPPLRERREDIPLLVEHFMSQFQRKLAKPLKSVAKDDMDRLLAYPWPGNIRELQNVIERACILARGPDVEITESLSVADGHHAFGVPTEVPTLEKTERDAIQRALEATAWRIEGPKGAAQLLDINPSTLRSRMKQLGIRKSFSS
jgi:formate hydrogenlyase transcriptional activator